MEPSIGLGLAFLGVLTGVLLGVLADLVLGLVLRRVLGPVGPGPVHEGCAVTRSTKAEDSFSMRGASLSSVATW